MICRKCNIRYNISINNYLRLIKKNIKSFTLNDAIIFLKYPKRINKDITIYIGSEGFYMRYKNRNYNIDYSKKYTEEYCMSIINN